MGEENQDCRILIVDDTLKNIQVLGTVLKKEGYQLNVAQNGLQALEVLTKVTPDLILLDVMMPELDGHETCKRLKDNPDTKDIPVIFLTAKVETDDIVKGFQLGAVDYITKPFNPSELLARVETHRTIRRLQKQLEERHEELQASYDSLQAAEQARDGLTHMIVHDLRAPLMGISGYLELLEMMEGDNLSEDGNNYVQQATTSSETMIEMVSSLLDVSKMESGEMRLNPSECDLAAIAAEVIGKLESLKGDKQLVLEVPEGPATFVCDAELVPRILQNLVGNSLKFTPEGGEVRVELVPGEEKFRVAVHDTGPGIPADYKDKIFEKFGQVDMREHKQKHSTGLGLTFCKLAVEAHGGEIGVDSEVGKGSTFWFELPPSEPMPEEEI